MVKKITYYNVAFLLVFLLAVPVLADKYTIDAFEGEDPGDPDKYIAEEFAGGLKPVAVKDISEQSGRFYVRQKFEDPFGEEPPSYQIYRGRSTSAKSQLSKVSVSGLGISELVKLKFYLSQNPKGDDDIDVVYFDGKSAYVEGDDPIYAYVDGKITELKSSLDKELKVSVTSQPSGATVTLNDVVKGRAPVTFSVGSTRPIAVVVSMNGYYTAIKPIKPVDGKTVQESVSLAAKKDLENPAIAFRNQLKNAKDVAAVKKAIQQKVNNYSTESKSAIDAHLTKFPANPPKLSEESSSDYSARQNLWDAEKAKEREALVAQSNGYLTELKDLLSEAESMAGESDFALRYEYIPASAISFDNLGIKDFTLSASVKNSRVKFEYSKAQLSYGSISRNKFMNDQENVHGVLKIWDKPNENGKYASIYDIAFFYDETPLTLVKKGSFVNVTEANSSSRNTERDLNSRINKYSGFSAWSKRDESATLDALRAGEIPDPAAVKPPPPPPVVAKSSAKEKEASYDEDEDEEEFEEEMAEQEERDYSKYGAVGSATDVFGNTDEYLFWTGMVFAAAAISTGVIGAMQMMKYNDAKKDVDDSDAYIETIKQGFRNTCQTTDPGRVDDCSRAAENHAKRSGWDLDDNPLWKADQYQRENKKVMESYQKASIIFISAAAVSLGVSITLFAW